MAMACAPRGRTAGAMGLAAGGRMKQSLYPDPHGLDVWDASRTSRVFVHIVNSMLWREITGEEPPPCPITARDYAAHQWPWFEIYDEALGALTETAMLGHVKSVKELDSQEATTPQQDDDPVNVAPVKKVCGVVAGALGVRDGKW